MESFENLIAWQSGMKLVKTVYTLTKQLPKEECYGLSSQLRRASTSILANLAEGYARKTPPDKASRYVIARGKCSETHALILICTELDYFSKDETRECIDLLHTTGKLLTGLIKAHSSNPNPNPNPTHALR